MIFVNKIPHKCPQICLIQTYSSNFEEPGLTRKINIWAFITANEAVVFYDLNKRLESVSLYATGIDYFKKWMFWFVSNVSTENWEELNVNFIYHLW